MKGTTWFRRLDRVLAKLCAWMSWISTACMVTVAILAFVDVIAAKVFGRGILGATEYITYMLIPIIYLALAHVQLTDGPLRVDMLYNRFGSAGKRVVDVFGNLLSIGILVYMTCRGAELTRIMLRTAERSSTASTSFPLWPFALLFTFGLGLLAFTHLWTTLRMFLAKEGGGEK